MKDQLIDAVVSKVGIDKAQAEQAVDTVLDFLKENPDKLTDLLGSGGGVGDRLKGMLGR